MDFSIVLMDILKQVFTELADKLIALLVANLPTIFMILGIWFCSIKIINIFINLIYDTVETSQVKYEKKPKKRPLIMQDNSLFGCMNSIFEDITLIPEFASSLWTINKNKRHKKYDSILGMGSSDKHRERTFKNKEIEDSFNSTDDWEKDLFW